MTKRNNKRHPSTIKIGDIPTEQQRYEQPCSAYQPKLRKRDHFWMLTDESDNRREVMAQARRDREAKEAITTGGGKTT